MKKNLTHHKVNYPNYVEAADFLQELDDGKGKNPSESCIGQRVHIPLFKLDPALNFWKNIYFGITAEGRLLSGLEAYDLGDDKTQVHPDKDPYIAMCNLMALEAIIRMGETYPTTPDPQKMTNGSRRERAVADFWKNTFAPTLFQVNWAWKAAMAVMAGEPNATKELLEDFREQLP